MSDQVNTSVTNKKPPLERRKKRSWLRILLWALFFLIVGIAIAALILWVNRYSLIERQVRQELEKTGIEGAFDIESIDRSKAILKNMRFSDEDGPFFAADELIVEYRFEQVRAGIVDKIVLKKPTLRLTLDGSGNLIDRWVPESSESSEPFKVPKDGVYIEDGLVNWAAPWGAGATGLNAQILSEISWKSQIEMQSARYAQEDIEFDYSFSGEVDRSSEYAMSVTGKLTSPAARLRQARTGPVETNIDLNISGEESSDIVAVVGKVDVGVSGGEFPSFTMGYTDLDAQLDVQFNLASEGFERFDADWDFLGSDLSMTDPQMRKSLVHRTMSYQALSKTPIAMHFADELERNGRAFFEKFSANGSGRYSHSDNGYVVELARPMTLEAERQKVVLSPVPGPEVEYDKDASKVEFDMHVDWDNSRDINMRNFNLSGPSVNGLTLAGVDAVSADIKSRNTWTRTIGSETFRLAPLAIDLDYKNSERGGQVLMRGDIDYDGVLPGGRVRNLKTGGNVVVKTAGDRFALSFQPNETVRMDEFVSTTGWRAENVLFDLLEGDDVLTRSGKSQLFRSHLKNVRADVASPENDRHLKTQFEDLKISSDFGKSPQVWDMDIKGIEITSDDFPAPGTHVRSTEGVASVTQYDDDSIEFTVASPSTEISTDNVQITDLFIEMGGRPEDFTAEYKAGSVQLKGGEIPEVPMEGTARLKDGILTGNAVAPMPRTKNTPINIKYRSEEGDGSAHISIPKVVFTPRGLQPQYLISTLRGKLAEVSGEASAEFDFTFGGGGPVTSRGTTTLNNMNIGTLVGPATGVSAELTFKSMFPLETDGVQTATLAGFDAGFPLENGTIKFEIVPDGIRIDQAIWPVLSEEKGDGEIFISPMLWRFGNVENQAVVNVENLSLGTILSRMGNGSLSATGQISGRLPATINGVDVVIDEGRLAIEDGGVIRYRNKGIDTFAKDTKQPFYLGDDFAGSETGFAFKALEYFEYDELEALIDGPLDGEMTLRMQFGGKNPGVLAGTPFEFDVAVSGELGNIARDSVGAFDSQKHLQAIIDQKTETGENVEK